jgi:hypothetical protein
MMTKPANPMAFPVSDIGAHGQFGMTLRDYFAGQSIDAVVLLSIESAKSGNATRDISERDMARACYSFADALLAASQEPTS